MADIDSIIAGVGGNTRYDFSTFGDPVKSYWEGKDQRAKNDLREAFKGGVPTLPDGSVDYASMQRTLYQKGGLEQGNALAGISARSGELEALRSADGPQPTVGPSTSRNTVMADSSKRADAATQPQPPQGAQGGSTVMQILAAQGIPNDQLGAASDSVARQIGVGATDPINKDDPRIRNVLIPAIQQLKRAGIGQV